jgi:hypothetical protein
MNEVDEKLLALDGHPFLREVSAFRSALLEVDSRISESWKWNAPSFLYDGNDRVTFRLSPGSTCQLILHRGARPVAGPSIDLGEAVDWMSEDRGVVAISSPDELERRTNELIDICLAWMRAETNVNGPST